MKGFICNVENFQTTVATARELGENGIFTRKEFEDFYANTRYKGWGQSPFYSFSSIRPILKVVKVETFTIKDGESVGYTNGIDTISEKAYKSLPTSIKPLFKKTDGVIECKRYYYMVDDNEYKKLILLHNLVCMERINSISDEIEYLKSKLDSYHSYMV